VELGKVRVTERILGRQALVGVEHEQLPVHPHARVRHIPPIKGWSPEPYKIRERDEMPCGPLVNNPDPGTLDPAHHTTRSHT
jgi:hypothetical protein